MSEHIDQSARVRAGYSEGPSVVLADGQTWTFPALAVRIGVEPRRTPDGRFAAGVVHTVDGRDLPRYAEWHRAISLPGVPAEEFWGARMEAAATLLLINYELADAELAALLRWTADDAASDDRWRAIDAAIRGDGGPKAIPAT